MIAELSLVLANKSLFVNAFVIAILGLADIAADTQAQHWTLTTGLVSAVVWLVRQLNQLSIKQDIDRKYFIDKTEQEHMACSAERLKREEILDKLIDTSSRSSDNMVNELKVLNSALTGPIKQLIEKGLNSK